MFAAERELLLCDAGEVKGSYRVALGRGGLGKRRAGDGKTPLGDYPLGEPRASSDYHLFIPLSYPTATQARAGHTGGDLGIHGPKRRYRWAARANAWFDWTRGCIAVATDEEIEAVARFVRERRPGQVHIE